MIYEVVPTAALHIKPMAQRMRKAHMIGLDQHGFDARRSLHDAVKKSQISRTALVDGVPVAMWGILGPLLADGVLVWLVMSDAVTAFPKTIVNEARKQLADIGRGYSELATTVLPEDGQSVAFAVFLGFHDRHGAEFDRMTRKQRITELLENPQHRIPVGNRYVIALGWHGA